MQISEICFAAQDAKVATIDAELWDGWLQFLQKLENWDSVRPKSCSRFSSARAGVQNLSLHTLWLARFQITAPARLQLPRRHRPLLILPVMDEMVRDFKVAESSSESASVFRQPGSGLPDKPLKTFNPVNSQCKSVCCTVLIHIWELSPCWVCLRRVKLDSLRMEHYLCECTRVRKQLLTRVFFSASSLE